MKISPGWKTTWSWGWMCSYQTAVHCWEEAVQPSVSAQAPRALSRHLPGGGQWDSRKTLLCTLIHYYLLLQAQTTKHFPKYPLDVSVLCRFQGPWSCRRPRRQPAPGSAAALRSPRLGLGCRAKGEAPQETPQSWELLPRSSSSFQGQSLGRLFCSRL